MRAINQNELNSSRLLCKRDEQAAWMGMENENDVAKQHGVDVFMIRIYIVARLNGIECNLILLVSSNVSLSTGFTFHQNWLDDVCWQWNYFHLFHNSKQFIHVSKVSRSIFWMYFFCSFLL